MRDLISPRAESHGVALSEATGSPLFTVLLPVIRPPLFLPFAIEGVVYPAIEESARLAAVGRRTSMNQSRGYR